MMPSQPVLVVDPLWCTRKEIVAATAELRHSIEVCDAGIGERCPCAWDACGVIGLDAEWSTTVVEGHGKSARVRTVSKLAVLQLATPRAIVVVKLIGLFTQLDALRAQPQEPHASTPSSLSACYGELLELLQVLQAVLLDARLIKVGVGVMRDAEKLMRDWGIQTRHCIELSRLQDVAVEMQDDGLPSQSTRCGSLKDLAQFWCGIELEKDMGLTMSDWASSAAPLSARQVEYAALDAAASRSVALAMLSRITPRQSASPVTTCSPPLIARLLDQPASTQRRQGAQLSQTNAPSETTILNAANVYECRKKAYYDNIRVFCPEGTLLFTVDARKADWYVNKKQLATVIAYRTDDGRVVTPTDTAAATTGDTTLSMDAIRLSFAPNFGRYNDAHIRRDMDYYRRPKENKCVVCGVPDKVIRCAVVPLMYRKYFPQSYVSHNSYDFLLVCPSCSVKVKFYHDQEREKIAKEFGFPLATNRKQPATPTTVLSPDSMQPSSVFEFVQATRSVVQQLIKYANALLRVHGVASTPTKSKKPIEARSRPSRNCEPCRENIEQEALTEWSATQPSEPIAHVQPSSEERLRLNRRASTQSEKPKKATAHTIPPARIALMERFVSQHAPLYQSFSGGQDDEALDATQYVDDKTLLLRTMAAADLHTVVSRVVAHKHRSSNDNAQMYPDDDNLAAEKAPPCVAASPATAAAVAGDPSLPIDNHAAFVVAQLLQRQAGPDYGVGEFIYRWRRLFLDKLQPQHLPIGWDPTDGILLPE